MKFYSQMHWLIMIDFFLHSMFIDLNIHDEEQPSRRSIEILLFSTISDVSRESHEKSVFTTGHCEYSLLVK